MPSVERPDKGCLPQRAKPHLPEHNRDKVASALAPVPCEAQAPVTEGCGSD